MMAGKRIVILLCLCSSVLLSIPWLIPHTGIVCLFALVPLLCADRIAAQIGLGRFWIYHYLTFVLWNAFTTFWVCNATVGGGIFAVLCNALQMSLIWGIFRYFARLHKGALPYILLASLWIAWERWYLTSAQISWPWLVLGNAFATSVKTIQWYSITGTLGGSLWVWLSNLCVFLLMTALSDGRWNRWNLKARFSATAALTVIVAGPVITSACMYLSYRERSESTVETVIGQPNLDPYQKFHSFSQTRQTAILLDRFRDAFHNSLDGNDHILFLAPETFTSDIVTNNPSGSPTVQAFVSFLRDCPNSSLVFGASTYDIVNKRAAPTPLAYPYGDGWLVSHNSAVVTDTSGRVDMTHKSKLVVGTEFTPYPKVFIPLERLICDVFGLQGPLIGRCVGQSEPGVLRLKDGTLLGCAVCYESVFGEYCKGYTDKGADLLAVITNDAWWGDTPGYRQHLSYSRLRAIELRRDLVRCGNTGISALIDQRGEIVRQGPWWEEATVCVTANLNSGKSVFATYGDMVGRACTLLAVLLLLFFLCVGFKKLEG